MKKTSKDVSTSRRQFARAVVTAAVAAPIVSSMVGCSKESPTNTPSGAPTGTPTRTPVAATTPCIPVEHDGYTEIRFGNLINIEEHIPPMKLDGGGSLIVESKNKLETPGGGSAPFNYAEKEPIDTINRYGEIDQVLVISETGLDDPPFLDAVLYKGFLPGTQLWLWNQDISPSSVGEDDTDFPPVTFPDADPDVKFIGGRGANKFKMFIKRKKLDEDKSHKKNRPNRFTHKPVGASRHFRIGQWRLVKSDGTVLVGHSGADNYTFYVTYAHFVP